MPILAGQRKKFQLNSSMVILNAPEDCECERVAEDHVIITLLSLPECKIHLDIVPYEQRYDPNDATEAHRNNGPAIDSLRENIHRRFDFLPEVRFRNDEFSQPITNPEFEGWYRVSWRNPEGIGMDVWLHRYEGWMFRVMASELTDEEERETESLHIRSLIQSIAIYI